MPSGGWRGGGRPRAWRLRLGEPAKLTRLEIPKDFASDLKEVAHMFDREELTLEQIKILREFLKTQPIEEIKPNSNPE